MKSPKILLAHPGTQHSKYLAIQLYKKGILFKYCTGFTIPVTNALVKASLFLLPKKIKQKLKNRFLPVVPAKLLQIFPFVELKAIGKLKDHTSHKEEVFFKRNELFQQKIPAKLLKGADLIIGFDTSLWILATRAKKLNKKVILDQTTAEAVGKAEILKEVATKYPLWKFDIEDRYGAYTQVDFIEQQAADKIVVASTYSKETLVNKNVSPGKIVVNPYGTDLTRFVPAPATPDLDLITFLFVGSVTALKGVPLLLDAWERVNKKNAILLLAGPISDDVRRMIGEREQVKILGAFPKEELPKVYQMAHVFVFPSYTEGFGQVILEALATGLPVITTENTGGKDLIKNNKNGFIIPAGSVEALTKALEYFIVNPSEIKEMSIDSITTAQQYSWERYGERWQKIIDEVLLSEV